MDSQKIKIMKIGVMLSTQIKILRPLIVNIIKSLPFLFLLWGISRTGYIILNSNSFKTATDPQLKLAFISTFYGGIGAMLIAIFQMYINFLQPNYSKDIRELLLINNKFLILKESGLLNEEELIDLLKRNQEIYAEQKVSKKDNESLKGLMKYYDKLNSEAEAITRQQEIRDKILNSKVN